MLDLQYDKKKPIAFLRSTFQRGNLINLFSLHCWIPFFLPETNSNHPCSGAFAVSFREGTGTATSWNGTYI